MPPARSGNASTRWRRDQRLHAVTLLLNHYRPVSSLAFCNTKQQCRDLVSVLRGHGFHALELHGDLEQRDRDQVLIQFANRSCSVLVATDVAARGLDITQLEAVINVDIAQDPEIHVHRIGRTGRADEAGWAFSLASLEEMPRIARIEDMQRSEAEWHPLSELRPARPEPLLPPMVTVQLLGGRKEKIRPGDVLGALTGEARLCRHADRQDQRDGLRHLRRRGSRHRTPAGGASVVGQDQGKEREGAADAGLDIMAASLRADDPDVQDRLLGSRFAVAPIQEEGEQYRCVLHCLQASGPRRRAGRASGWPRRVQASLEETSTTPSMHWIVTSPETLCGGIPLPASSTSRITSRSCALNKRGADRGTQAVPQRADIDDLPRFGVRKCHCACPPSTDPVAPV